MTRPNRLLHSIVAERDLRRLSYKAHTPEFVIEGDSRGASSYTAPGNAKNGNGLAFAIEATSRGRIRVPYDLLFAVSGNRTSDVRARAPTVAASRAAGVILLIGTNDRGVLSLQTSMDNITAAIGAYRAGGKQVIIISELPRGGAFAMSNPELAEHLRLVRWLNTWADVEGVFVADVWNLMVNPTSAQAVHQSVMLFDDLHQSPSGAWRIGQRVAAILATLYPEPAGLLLSSNADLWHASNPSGNNVTNGMMAGTGGTPGTEITGSVADGWVASRSGSGFTAAVAKGTLASGRAAQQVTLNGNSNTASPYFLLSRQMNTGGLNAGDLVEGVLEYEIDAGAANVDQPWLQLSAVGSSTTYAYTGYAPALGDCPAFATGGIMRTPPLLIPAGALTWVPVNIFWYGRQNLAAAGVARFGALSVRKLIPGDY